jgi:hypothetical protein
MGLINGIQFNILLQAAGYIGNFNVFGCLYTVNQFFDKAAGSFSETFGQDSRKFISLSLETGNGKRFCIHDRIEMFVGTAFYESGCNFLGNRFFGKFDREAAA